MSKRSLGIAGAILIAGVFVVERMVVRHPTRHMPAEQELASAESEPSPEPNTSSTRPKPDSQVATSTMPSARRLPVGRRADTGPPVADAAIRAVDEIRIGQRLTAGQAEELEAKLVQTPDDLSARCQLLGYYFLLRFGSKSAREARQGHVQWLIQHHPELDVRAYADLDPILDGAAYGQAKTTWLQQVNDNAQSAAILGNAAQFLLLHDRTTAEDLMKQGQVLEPANPAWSDRLAQLYALDAHSAEPDAARQAAIKALEQMENAQANTTGPMVKFHNLNKLAQMAFDAGEIQKAGGYAAALLQQAADLESGWDSGDAVYRGNLVLGRIALRGGSLEEAKQYLLASARTTGSPVLGSFGPNMTLAKELLEQGEKEVVLEYFSACGKFWKSEKLAGWTQQVNEGWIPDFGANLVY